jgi:glycine oxidase
VKVIVVGGGVIGCSIAYYLQEAGASTVLLERGEIGGEASGAAAGMLIAPIEDTGNEAFNCLRRASLEMYPALIKQVQSRSGLNIEYKRPGMLRTAVTVQAAAALRAIAQEQPDLDWVGQADLSVLEPALSPRVLGALFSEADADLNPGLWTNALALAAERMGAEVRRRTVATGFLRKGGDVRGVSTDTGDVLADAVVIAAGPWTGPLGSRLGWRAPTPPMRGQMIAYRSNALRHAVWGEEGYLVPKPRGFLWAGATVEAAGFRKRTTERGLAGLRRMATTYVPALRDAEVASEWAGLRPGSPDGQPVIGRLPGRDNAYVATGHFRNGILLAPITGALVRDLVLEGRIDGLLSPFAPDRFG